MLDRLQEDRSRLDVWIVGVGQRIALSLLPKGRTNLLEVKQQPRSSGKSVSKPKLNLHIKSSVEEDLDVFGL